MSKKKEPIRILQCVSNMDRAGIETMLMNFYRNIDRDAVQFDFLCNKSKPGDYDEEIKKLGGNIYVSPGLNPFKWYEYQEYMKRLFKEHPEYKVIHCQNEAMGFPALYAAKKANVPIRISHSHNTVTRFDFKWPIKILYKYLLRFVATDCFACGTDAGKYLFGKEVDVIHNAIDIEKFKYSEINREKVRSELNISKKFVIGHVGRFEPQKNHLFLIKMFFEYQKLNNNAILLLIGTGSLEKKIKKIVENLKIKDKVIFLGSVQNVNDYYNAMDVFVLPSLHEGLPVVGIEAQINGLPCIFSTKITPEVKIIPESKFLKINKNYYNEWCSEIKKHENMTRNDVSKFIASSGYSINDEVKKLEQRYLKMVGDIK